MYNIDCLGTRTTTEDSPISTTRAFTHSRQKEDRAPLNPSLRQVQKQYDRTSEEFVTAHWHLDHLKRKDLMQADVAPLAALLIGLAVPVNSVGVLPFEYLDAKSSYRLQALAMNALQLLKHVEFKSQLLESRRRLFFRPFPHLDEAQTLMNDVVSHLATSADYRESEFEVKLENAAFHVIELCHEALDYYQTYDWTFLMSVITLGYVTWIALLLRGYTSFQNPSASPRASTAVMPNSRLSLVSLVGFGAVLALICLYLVLQHAPWSYYGYCVFPWFFSSLWWIDTGPQRPDETRRRKSSDIAAFTLSLLGVEGLVLGYQHRQVFSLIFIALSAVLRQKDDENNTQWTLSCLTLSVFPLLPSEYGEHLYLVLGGGLGVLLYFQRLQDRRTSVSIQRTQCGLLLSAMFQLVLTMRYLESKTKPPKMLFLLNWIISLASIGLIVLFPWISSTKTHERVWTPSEIWSIICLGLTPVYLLLSISYEVLFWVSLCWCLTIWMNLETITTSVPSLSRDCRVAFCYLLFIKIGFFGTGNIASMSSFEISSTYRFVTVFSPFLMGALLVLKILLPMILATVAFQLITRSSITTHTSTTTGFRLFFLILAMCDVLSLHFFFLVRHEGSWKEIGNSISQFGIVNAQIVLIPLLYGIALLFVLSYGSSRAKDQ